MKRIVIYCRYETSEIAEAKANIEKFLSNKAKLVTDNPDFVIVIGGDGAILSAVIQYHEPNVTFMGINKGTVGFLASIDKSHDYLKAVENLIQGNYETTSRQLVNAKVIREDEEIYSVDALNEVVVSSPLSVVKLKVFVDSIDYLRLNGTGVLVSTATGSTAYNLSAHGPILSPQLDSLIVTELMDHSVPTPSLVIENNREIKIQVGDFKRQGQLKLDSGEPADVVLDADGSSLFSLKARDEIILTGSNRKVRFVEFDEYNFLTRLRNKLRIGDA